jgi:hypothetical protein
MSNLEYRIAVGGGVPLLLAIIGVIGKKLARRTMGWKRTDFYLGVEFTLAGISATVSNLLSVFLKPGRDFGKLDFNMLGVNVLALVLGMLLFLFVLTLHQDHEDETHVDRKRIRELKILMGVSNLIGFVVLLGAVALTLD